MSSTELTIPTPAAVPERRWRRLVALLFVVDLVFVVLNGIWYANYLVDEGPPFPPEPNELIWIHLVAIALGSIVASPAFALISHLGRRAGVPLGAGALAALLGVFGFLAAARVNDAIVFVGLVAPAGSDGFDAFSLVVAPAVEEPTKLLVLVVMAILLRPRFGVRQGIVLGLMVGIGGTLVETGGYLQAAYAAGGGPIYGTIIAVRLGLFGLGLHATTAALTGAGLGYAISVGPGRRRVVVLALAGAIAIHVLWNAIASGWTLDLVTTLTPEPDFGGQEPYAHHIVWIASSIVTAVLLAPTALALSVAWRRSPRS